MIHSLNLNSTQDLVFRASSLDPGKVQRASALLCYPGGKGSNVARTAALLGGRARLVALAARQDLAGTRAFFARQGLAAVLVPVPGKARPCVIVHDARRDLETVLNSPSTVRPGAAHLATLTRRLLERLKPGDLVTLSGTLPASLPPDSFASLIRRVRARGGLAILDSSGPFLRLGLKAGPFLVKPNLEELEELSGRRLRSAAALKAAARGLARRGARFVCVSLGGRGALLAGRDSLFHVPALRPGPGPHSPIGCGDAFVGGLAYGLSRGEGLTGALRWATASGWANLHHFGAAFMAASEVREAVGRVEIRKA